MSEAKESNDKKIKIINEFEKIKSEGADAGMVNLALNFAGNNITSKGASLLFNTLRESKLNVRTVNLYRNQLDDDCMKSLGFYVKENNNVEGVFIGENNITDKGIGAFSSSIIGNVTLKKFGISSNDEITNRSVPVLINLIEKSSIESICTYGTSISQSNIFAVALSMNIFKNGSLEMNFCEEGITDENIRDICQGMNKYGCNKLKELIFAGNLVSSKAAILLLDTLRLGNSCIRQLDISHNKIDDEIMISLGEFIQHNKCLESIMLGYNGITDAGIETLAYYLIGNISIRNLSLPWNKGITSKSVPFIIEIAKTTNIEKIKLNGIKMSEKEREEIDECLNKPIDAREIPVLSSAKSAAKSKR